MIEKEMFEMSMDRNQGKDMYISRRKLLASVGMAGVFAASGGLIGAAQAGGTVNESVYGNGLTAKDTEQMLQNWVDGKVVRIITIAELRAMSAAPQGHSVYYVKDKGQEGIFLYDGTDTATADNTGTVLVSAAGARFKRVYDDAVSIKWFGAKGDGVTDDTRASQQCFDAAKSATVYIPEGTYNITSTIVVPELTSIRGSGYASQLHGYSCDCLTFDLSNGLSPVVAEKFAIFGHDASGFTAIRVPGAPTTLRRTTGITFSNLYIAFYGTGMSLRGLWHSRIYGCYMNDVWVGIQIIGQSVKNVIDSCQIIRGNGYTKGSGDSMAIYVDSAFDYEPGNAERRPEDVQITKTLTFGFDIGVRWYRCLYGAIKECDFDYCRKYGIYYHQTEGGLTISNNWIALTEDQAIAGIRAGNLGVPGTSASCLIQHNTIGHYVGTNRQGTGISIGWNQNNTVIDGNHISGMATEDIVVDYCQNIHISKNTLTSPITNSVRIVSRQNPIFINENKANGGTLYDPGIEQIMINNRFVKNSVPTGGQWTKGDIVYNTNPLPADGRFVMGWYRVTDGTGHVLGTDWLEIGN